LKIRPKTARILSKLFFLFVLCFFSECCYKVPHVIKKPSEKIYQGTIWWQIYIFESNQTKTLNGYADFQAGKNFIYLKFKSPFHTALGYGKWEISSFNLIEIFDLYHRKHYLIKFTNHSELKNLPFYFLGLKRKNLSWKFIKTYFYYSFVEDKKEGLITSDFLKLKWKIKNLSTTEGFKPLLKDTAFFKDFQKVKITF